MRPSTRRRTGTTRRTAELPRCSPGWCPPRLRQLEDFAATSTTEQKRNVETERFRDYVLELQPMADMLTVVVTLHPRAEQAIGEMWRLADLPSFAHDRVENDSPVVVPHEVNNAERARKLIQPYLYLDTARKNPGRRRRRLIS